MLNTPNTFAPGVFGRRQSLKRIHTPRCTPPRSLANVCCSQHRRDVQPIRFIPQAAIANSQQEASV